MKINSDSRNHLYQRRGVKIFLVENLTLLARARIYAFSRDLTCSRLASNSKLDVRPVEVESRQSAKENDSVVEAADDGKVVVILDALVPKWAPRALIGILEFLDEDWGI